MGKSPYRFPALLTLMLTAVMTSATNNELRDMHAARFAEMAALREMLVHAGDGEHEEDLAGRMRDAVAEILRLQKIISRIEA